MKEVVLPNSNTIRTGLLILLGWMAAGLFYFTQDFVPRLYRNETTPWQSVFTGWMAAMLICAVLTPSLLWLGRRWPIGEGNRWRHVALHVGFSAVFSAVSTGLEVPVLKGLGVFPGRAEMGFRDAYSMMLIYSFHGGVIRYWAVLGMQAVYRAHQRAQQREREALRLQVESSELAAQLSGAQLSALKMQLQPHFLFNTLGAIMALVRQQNTAEAEVMIGRLSDLLRLTLEDVEAHEVPLWRELEFLRLYLSIEQVRFRDRLRVEVSADPELSDALVPHMALQPIVENAVRHGLGQSEQPVMIDVKASRVGDQLVLTVTDDGPGSPTTGFESNGIGLANTRARLVRLYGEGATLRIDNRLPRGVQVTITLPCA